MLDREVLFIVCSKHRHYKTSFALEMYSDNDFLDEDFDLSTTKQGPSSSLTGNMNSSPQPSQNIQTPKLDTLDEPVSVTLLRDLGAVWNKLKQVLVPVASNKNVLRDWDLWGPLLLCLVLSMYAFHDLVSLIAGYLSLHLNLKPRSYLQVCL